MLVRELDLAPGLNTTDGRRLEVIANGLTLFQGAQLAIDTTLALLALVQPRQQVRLWQMRDHERRPPLLSSLGSRAKLVLAAEVSGRWSAETA